MSAWGVFTQGVFAWGVSAQEGVCPGESAWGVSAQGVSAKKGDVYPWKVSAQMGVCRGREVSA